MADAPARFPDVSGTALDGTALALPRDLPAAWNLLVVTFRDELDPLSDRWVLLGKRLAEGSEGRLSTFELHVLGKGFRLFRPIVHETMRAQADDADEQARTIPLHVDKGAFARALDVRDQDTAHVFLVARDGRIAWRGAGLLTPDLVAALEAAVGETLSDRTAADAPPAPAGERFSGSPLSADAGAAGDLPA